MENIKRTDDVESVLKPLSISLFLIMMLILLITTLLIIFQTMQYVRVFASLGMSLPFLTRLSLWVGQVLKDYWYIWLFLYLVIGCIGAILEVFVKDRKRIINIIIYLAFIFTSWFVVMLYDFSMSMLFSMICTASMRKD